MPKTLFFANYNGVALPGQQPFLRGAASLAYENAAYIVSIDGGAMIEPIPVYNWSSLRQVVANKFGDWHPTESEYQPGTAYKRIALPIAGYGDLDGAIDTNARTQSYVALRLLLARMDDLFQNVEPGPLNGQAFGHKVRELLLLASMETEASWAAVLKANQYKRQKRLDTRDYVKLLSPMALDSYSLGLASYPNFPKFAPLRGWDAKCATKSLSWYDAYNKTKHNREEHLCDATFERAIHAVGATVVMYFAQYGFSLTSGDERLRSIRNIFTIDFDKDRHPHTIYIATLGSLTGPSKWVWKLLEHPLLGTASTLGH